MCSGSEAGSYLRLIDFVLHSTLGLRVIKKKRRRYHGLERGRVRERRAPTPLSDLSHVTSCKQKENDLKGLKDFYLKAKARIWP